LPSGGRRIHERATVQLDANLVLPEAHVDVGRLEGKLSGVYDERELTMTRNNGHPILSI
jgi:hypothetical protein